MRDTYLYRWSAEDARRQNELALWRASHLENIACKKAIEEAVRQHYDGAYLDDNCLSDVLQEFGYKRTAWYWPIPSSSRSGMVALVARTRHGPSKPISHRISSTIWTLW